MARERRICRLSSLAASFALVLSAASGPAGALPDAPGDDWTLPAWVEPSPSSGFFSEEAAPASNVNLRVADFTWRQLQPTQGSFSMTTSDSVYGMNFPSWNAQLAGSDPYWLRLWVSGDDWAPQWVKTLCSVSPVGTGYENDEHLPIWNTCFWQQAREFFRQVLIVHGLRSDARMKFLYAPGAFTWCEFDFDVPTQAADNFGLTFPTFDNWFQPAMQDLVNLMNGENADPGDDFAWKLVFTGEDYPFAPWDAQDDFLARDAVAKGMGIRNGITEEFNFHLNQAPAYGTTIASDGHLVTNENWPGLDGRRVVATENECFNDCGFTVSDTAYAVKMANLRALVLRMNWIYVVPGPSYMSTYAALWQWTRLELGKRVWDSPDAWAALRDAEDTYWIDDTSVTWTGVPYVRNLERWLVQRDVAPQGVTRRGTDMRSNDPTPENGTAYEGRRTELAAGRSSIYLDLDARFFAGGVVPVEVKVTYRDSGTGSFRIEYPGASGTQSTTSQTYANSGAWRTATFAIPDGLWNGDLPGATDLRLVATGPADLEARFVRVVRLTRPKAIFLEAFESGT
ncbi:MAG: hypothetical protein ABI639_00765, partial [Thermoanaerobaculia bacterium]